MHAGTNKQSLHSAGAVDHSKDDLDDGAGNQGIMFEYATDETENGDASTGSSCCRVEDNTTSQILSRTALVMKM